MTSEAAVRRTFREHEVRWFGDWAHVDVGMLSEIALERGSASLGRADDHEVGGFQAGSARGRAHRRGSHEVLGAAP